MFDHSKEEYPLFETDFAGIKRIRTISHVGIRMKSVLGRGGVVENNIMRNINMVNIQQEAVVLTMNYVHRNVNYDDNFKGIIFPNSLICFEN